MLKPINVKLGTYPNHLYPTVILIQQLQKMPQVNPALSRSSSEIFFEVQGILTPDPKKHTIYVRNLFCFLNTRK